MSGGLRCADDLVKRAVHNATSLSQLLRSDQPVSVGFPRLALPSEDEKTHQGKKDEYTTCCLNDGVLRKIGHGARLIIRCG